SHLRLGPLLQVHAVHRHQHPLALGQQHVPLPLPPPAFVALQRRRPRRPFAPYLGGDVDPLPLELGHPPARDEPRQEGNAPAQAARDLRHQARRRTRGAGNVGHLADGPGEGGEDEGDLGGGVGEQLVAAGFEVREGDGGVEPERGLFRGGEPVVLVQRVGDVGVRVGGHVLELLLRLECAGQMELQRAAHPRDADDVVQDRGDGSAVPRPGRALRGRAEHQPALLAERVGRPAVLEVVQVASLDGRRTIPLGSRLRCAGRPMDHRDGRVRHEEERRRRGREPRVGVARHARKGFGGRDRGRPEDGVGENARGGVLSARSGRRHAAMWGGPPGGHRSRSAQWDPSPRRAWPRRRIRPSRHNANASVLPDIRPRPTTSGLHLLHLLVPRRPRFPDPPILLPRRIAPHERPPKVGQHLRGAPAPQRRVQRRRLLGGIHVHQRLLERAGRVLARRLFGGRQRAPVHGRERRQLPRRAADHAEADDVALAHLGGLVPHDGAAAPSRARDREHGAAAPCQDGGAAGVPPWNEEGGVRAAHEAEGDEGARGVATGGGFAPGRGVGGLEEAALEGVVVPSGAVGVDRREARDGGGLGGVGSEGNGGCAAHGGKVRVGWGVVEGVLQLRGGGRCVQGREECGFGGGGGVDPDGDRVGRRGLPRAPRRRPRAGRNPRIRPCPRPRLRIRSHPRAPRPRPLRDRPHPRAPHRPRAPRYLPRARGHLLPLPLQRPRLHLVQPPPFRLAQPGLVPPHLAPPRIPLFLARKAGHLLRRAAGAQDGDQCFGVRDQLAARHRRAGERARDLRQRAIGNHAPLRPQQPGRAQERRGGAAAVEHHGPLHPVHQVAGVGAVRRVPELRARGQVRVHQQPRVARRPGVREAHAPPPLGHLDPLGRVQAGGGLGGGAPRVQRGMQPLAAALPERPPFLVAGLLAVRGRGVQEPVRFLGGGAQKGAVLLAAEVHEVCAHAQREEQQGDCGAGGKRISSCRYLQRRERAHGCRSAARRCSTRR
ncbi:hypothetical protein DFJ74DRAFT_733910, partial [Hyaloraphidium curvatum]